MSDRYVLELRPVAGRRCPPIIRLRKLLKALARSYGLRVTSIRREDPR